MCVDCVKMKDNSEQISAVTEHRQTDNTIAPFTFYSRLLFYDFLQGTVWDLGKYAPLESVEKMDTTAVSMRSAFFVTFPHRFLLL